MAALGIRCGGNHQSIHNPRSSFRIDRWNQISQFKHSLSIPNHTMKRSPQRISAASTTVSSPPIISHRNNNVESYNEIVNEKYQYRDFHHKEAEFPEKLHGWMRDSVADIVKNLKQAPLLVQLYADNNGSATKMKTEKAVSENWPDVIREWRDGERPSPDGVILVEELGDERELNEDVEQAEVRAWGIVIQGKGAEHGPVCYLLKTSRVRAGFGLFCTHFCLVRVNSFKESALSQLTKCWLVQ